jgi:hypothetical protein
MCKAVLKASEALLQHEWQGRLWVICFSCWKPSDTTKSEASWKKMRKASWADRVTNAKSALRGENLAHSLVKVQRLTDESVREWKRRAIMVTVKMVARIVVSTLKLSESQKAAVDNAFDRWEAEKQRIIASGTGECSATPMNVCGNVLPSEAADMASELMAGVSEYYMCRKIIVTWKEDPATKQWSSTQKACGYFSVSKNWCSTDPSFQGGHYRCPQCGVLYQPWVVREKFIGPNKLLVLETDTETKAMMRNLVRMPAEDVAAGLQPLGTSSVGAASSSGVASGVAAGPQSAGTPQEGTDITYIPFYWPQTAERALMDRFKEIFLDVGNSLEGVPLEELPNKVAELDMARQITKSWWKQMSLTSEAKCEVDKVNAATSGEKYHYDHLAGTFIGSTFPYQEAMVTWDQDMLARVWGTARIAVREALRTAPRLA